MKLKNVMFIISFFTPFILLSQNFENINVKVDTLSKNIFMLTGAGGNIGICVGDDGVFIVDDQYAPLTPKIINAIKTLSDKPLNYLVNTHHHGDHTGGNENMFKLGATIIAHENVRKRLLEAVNKENSQLAKEALPAITFNDKLNFYVNNENVMVFHVDNAHTDGDAILYFLDSNVLHTGDTFFNKRYPFIDLNSGGTVNGYIDSVKRSLMIINDETKIIPGHGELASKTDYITFLNMLEHLKSAILNKIELGKTEEEVVNDNSITKQYDELGYSWNFITSEKIRRTFYQSLKR